MPLDWRQGALIQGTYEDYITGVVQWIVLEVGLWFTLSNDRFHDPFFCAFFIGSGLFFIVILCNQVFY